MIISNMVISDSIVKPKSLLRGWSKINLLFFFSHWKPLSVTLPHSQFSLTRLHVPPLAHVPHNCLAPSLLHALPLSLYATVVPSKHNCYRLLHFSILFFLWEFSPGERNHRFSSGFYKITWDGLIKGRQPLVKNKSLFYPFTFCSVLSDTCESPHSDDLHTLKHKSVNSHPITNWSTTWHRHTHTHAILRALSAVIVFVYVMQSLSHLVSLLLLMTRRITEECHAQKPADSFAIYNK